MKDLPSSKKGLGARWLPALLLTATTCTVASNTAIANNDWQRASTTTSAGLMNRVNQPDTTEIVTPSATFTENTGRIVGGEVLEVPAPFMASVQINLGDGYVHVCGGSIISNFKVLTAAHCFDDLPATGDWRIAYGSNKINNLDDPTSSVQWSSVAEVYIHPAYQRGTFFNDVAVLRVTDAINATPLPLATPVNEPVFDGAIQGEVFGWGVTEEGSDFLSNELRYVSVPLQPQNICQEVFPTNPAVVNDVSFCAGFADGGFDACIGDSGGPIIAPSSQGPVQVGIVSFGIGCARPNLYGVYSRVSQYSDWLEAHASGVMLERPLNFGWVLPTQTHASTGVYPIITSTLRNNTNNAVDITAFDLRGIDNAQFGLESVNCVKTYASGESCELGVALMASHPGRYSAEISPALSQFNVPVTKQVITAEIPRALDAKDTLDTTLNIWYTGDDNPFKAASLPGAVGNRGLRSGNAWNSSLSALLGIIEGPGTLTFNYQYAAAENELVNIELNGQFVRPLPPQTNGWGNVTMSIPEGVNALSFLIGNPTGSSIEGVLHLDNFQFTGENGTDQPGPGTNNGNAGQGGSIFDQVFAIGDGNNSDGSNSGSTDTDFSTGTDLIDAILGGGSSDTPSTDSGDSSTPPSSGSIFDQVFAIGSGNNSSSDSNNDGPVIVVDNSDDSSSGDNNSGGDNTGDSSADNGNTGNIWDMVMGGSNNTSGDNSTDGNGIGQTVSDFFQNTTDYVVDNFIDPAIDNINNIFDEISDWFNFNN